MGDEESRWKDVWNLYDTERTGKVKKEDFLDCVRVCTRRYPLSVLTEKTKALGATVSYEAFFDFMMEPYTGPNAEDLDRALKAFDGKETGELTVMQIQTLLTTMGDKLNLNDVKPILDVLPQVAGKVKIAELVKFLTPPVPTAKPDVDELLRELVREEAAKMNFAEGEPEISSEIDAEFDARAARSQKSGRSKDSDGLGGIELESEGDSDDDDG
jgi:Ca2+-binding EF-hand superfamily protein